MYYSMWGFKFSVTSFHIYIYIYNCIYIKTTIRSHWHHSYLEIALTLNPPATATGKNRYGSYQKVLLKTVCDMPLLIFKKAYRTGLKCVFILVCVNWQCNQQNKRIYGSSALSNVYSKVMSCPSVTTKRHLVYIGETRYHF